MPALPNPHEVAAAMGDRGRMAMLMALHEGACLSASELATVAEVSRPTASAHLKRLEGVGLVCGETDGRKRVFTLSGAGAADAVASVWRFIDPEAEGPAAVALRPEKAPLGAAPSAKGAMPAQEDEAVPATGSGGGASAPLAVARADATISAPVSDDTDREILEIASGERAPALEAEPPRVTAEDEVTAKTLEPDAAAAILASLRARGGLDGAPEGARLTRAGRAILLARGLDPAVLEAGDLAEAEGPETMAAPLADGLYAMCLERGWIIDPPGDVTPDGQAALDQRFPVPEA
ncbi:winged helix-turn-helix domain-containing protein [Poseidonocella sedimentorum]|uniref:DNA-binding transcriptional regulator, ArsR family n=1 Tax=Poseidonocella sedimentorum TaxID=871652 RepID=A0A1I6DHI2_9RHOB|nr:winged helix-turn-helix domain-containing protein [Poseidonocella sedimentorum]SFR04848.1 DNA-binding transcriptional regulator, ArsR family [Poseidonocella sedimentorum]